MIDLDGFSEEDLKENRKQAEQYAKDQSTEDFWKYRKLAKTDLFFLTYSILGYDKLAKLHYDLCTWLKVHENMQYREVLLPRSHYKSTVLTIGHSIQLVLPDDTNSAAWPACLGTEGRVLLCHEVHDSAMLFLSEITSHFLSNPVLMGLFPECIPDLRKQRVNRQELELPRSKHHKEATFSTLGVGGRAQGKHFNYIKADDIIGDKARDSKSEMTAAKLWVDNIQSLLVTPKEDHIDFVGTRWSYDDLYAHIHDSYGPRLHKYIRGIEEVIDGERKLIFPEQFSPDSIAILRRNKKVFSAQYANDPKESADEFQPDWKQYYRWHPMKRSTITFGENDQDELNVFTELDRVILIDPAMQGLTGIAVTGMSANKKIFVLDTVKKSFSTPEFINTVFKLVQRWQPRTVGIEKVLFSALFEHMIVNEMNTRGVRFMIAPLKTFQKSKDFRVRGLAQYFSTQQVYFNETQVDLIEEFDKFGATEDYHILDALAHGPQIWKPCSPQYAYDNIGGASSPLALPPGMDSHSGYSSMWDEDD